MGETVKQSRMSRRRHDHQGALALWPAPREGEEGWEVFDGCEVGREAPDARLGVPLMTKTARHITLSPSRDIAFDKLMLSQSNVRKIKAGISVEELAEDIARRGLLQGLNVRPVLDEAGVETGMFEITAGGRRYQALALLVKQKRLAKTAPVPCVERHPHSAIMADDNSLAENVQRVALHPLDQFRAFVTHQALPDAVAVPAQNIRLTLATLFCQPDIQGIPCRKTGNGHHEVAPRIASQALNGAFVIALARAAIAVMDEVVRQEPAEQFGPLARAIRQDLRNEAPVIVIKHRLRHPAEERKGMDVAINPSLGHGSGVGPNKACITEGQIQREEMRLLLHAADHHHRLAEVGLCVAGGMSQWHKHLAASTTMFTDVILDRRVAALEAVLVP